MFDIMYLYNFVSYDIVNKYTIQYNAIQYNTITDFLSTHGQPLQVVFNFIFVCLFLLVAATTFCIRVP